VGLGHGGQVSPGVLEAQHNGTFLRSFGTALGLLTRSRLLCPQNSLAAQQAAILETRRYAAMLGCTTEFTKWEGITYSPSRKQLYTSMSTIGSGMLATVGNAYDVGGSVDVALPANPCGCVYAIDVDSTGSATTMTTTPSVITDGSVAAGGQGCDINGLSSPDGITYVPTLDTLFIQEDTSSHQNDAMWQYTFPAGAAPAGGNLTRIMAGPFGSEVTSTYWQTVGAFSYLKTVVQHPTARATSLRRWMPARLAQPPPPSATWAPSRCRRLLCRRRWWRRRWWWRL